MKFGTSLSAIMLLVLPFACFSQNTSVSSNSGVPLVSVTGVGTVNVSPDQAQLQVGINLRNNSLASVVNAVDNTTQAIITYLESNGVNSSDIQSSYISIQPVFGSNSSQDLTIPSYYSAQKSLIFLLTNLSNFNNIIQGLIQNGVNTIDSVAFQVGNETATIDQARQQAVSNAQEIATGLANDLGANLGNVFSITDETNVPSATAAGATASAPAIAGGQITVTSTIQVSFELSNQ